MTAALEPTPITTLLRDAEQRLRAGTVIPAAAHQRIADWLGSWSDTDVDEDGPMPEDLQYALRIARAITGPQEAR